MLAPSASPGGAGRAFGAELAIQARASICPSSRCHAALTRWHLSPGGTLCASGSSAVEYPPDVGGVGDQAARLAAALASRGHDVQVVTSARNRAPSPRSRPPPARGGAAATRPAGPAVLPAVLPAVRRWDWRLFALLPRLAREGRWDVLHLQYQPGAFQLDGTINLLPAGCGAGATPRRSSPPSTTCACPTSSPRPAG